MLVLSQEDLKEAAADSINLVDDPSDTGFDDFIDSEAKPDYVLDPGSWSPIFEPATAPQVHLEHEGEYYSSVSKIVKAYSRGDERAMEKAASEIEAAASAGHPHAQSILGFLYGMGIGRERSKAKSFLYHHFAAEGGNMQSKMALAYTYSRQEVSFLFLIFYQPEKSEAFRIAHILSVLCKNPAFVLVKHFMLLVRSELWSFNLFLVLGCRGKNRGIFPQGEL